MLRALLGLLALGVVPQAVLQQVPLLVEAAAAVAAAFLLIFILLLLRALAALLVFTPLSTVGAVLLVEGQGLGFRVQGSAFRV